MERVIIFSVIVMMSTTGSAQRMLQTSTNSYLNADKMVKQQISYPERISREKCHDMSDAEVLNKKYTVSYRVKNDSFPNRLTCIENGTQYHYELRNDSIFIGGYQNRMTQVEYDQPEVYLRLPMALGDSITGYFHGRGTYGGKLALRNYGWYKTKAEALERIVVSEGDTLDNVLRLHTERMISSKYYPIELTDSLLPFDEDSVKIYLSRDTAIINNIIDRWYALGYRYPVLEARATEKSKNVPLLTQALYFPPHDQQEQLCDDVENETIRKMLEEAAKENSADNANNNANSRGDNAFSYKISLDNSGNIVTINYDTDHNTKMTALVANTLGYVYRRVDHHCDSGNGQATIDCNGLRKGQYILYINVDGEQYAEKVNVK